MGSERDRKLDEIRKFERLLEKQTGKAVRPYRADSYVNLLNRYGTSKDTTEHYQFQQEPPVPDDMLTAYYEGNGLFAKIIDTPAEEAIKHGFEMSVKDQEIQDFYKGALDELDWEETAMTAIKWARLFGGSIVVMLINDGRGLDEPVDWKNIRSIDDLRVYDRSVIQEDTSSMFAYRPDDPFRTRSSRLGMPEYYDVFSRYGHFRVHDSRCLVFQNGILPENTTNSIYQMWGIPEYIRINRAIRDAEVAHGSAIKLLDRSIQAVYKMKDLAAELATEEGEDRVLRRLQTIDMARGLLNSITIDADGEDYDFRTFQFTGVSDVVDSACNYLSALTSIPQTILFGRSPAGMNSTGESDLENWYNYLERIQSRMVKKNLRYLLSVIFQAGVACGEIDEVPEISIEFNPLWSMSESEKASIDQQKAQTQQVRAQTAQIYMDAQVIDPSEVRRKLADSDEFDIENMLDEIDEEDLFANMPQGGDDDMLMGGGMPGDPSQAEPAPQENPPAKNAAETQGEIPEKSDFGKYAEGVDVEEHNTDPGTEGSAPTAAPAATKLPEDMSEEEKEKAAEKKDDRTDEGNSNSGNHGHSGRPGEIGGSAPSSSGLNSKVSSAYKSGDYSSVGKSIRSALKDMPSGSTVSSKGITYRKVDDDKFEYEVNGMKMTSNTNAIVNNADLFNEANAPTFEVATSSETAEQMVQNGELEPSETTVKIPSATGLKEAESGRAATDSNGELWVKDGDDWVNQMTGEVGTSDDVAGLGGEVMRYEGSRDFEYNGSVSQETMDKMMSELNRNQAELEGKAEISSADLESMVGSIKHYGMGGECQMILASQDPDHYQDLPMLRGQTSEEAAAYAKEAENIERFIELSDKVEGSVYRGIGFNDAYDDKGIIEDTLSQLRVGNTISMGHIASWSDAKGIAKSYSESVLNNEWEDGQNYAIVYSVANNKSAVSLRGINPQGECITPKSASYKVTNVNYSYDEEWECHRYEVEMEEV